LKGKTVAWTGDEVGVSLLVVVVSVAVLVDDV
jgi:hypothetical protein